MTISREDEHTVYLHRDALAAVLYVGCTGNLVQRSHSHISTASWSGLIYTIEVDSRHRTWALARARECELIEQLQPPFNLHHNPTRPRIRRSGPARLVHGPTLLGIRETLGIKQVDLARLVGIGAPHLSRIEGGSRQPTVNVMHRIAEALEVPVEDFTYPRTSYAGVA